MKFISSSCRVRGSRPGRQRGLALVEVAVALPFLLVMMLIAAEFTRAFYHFNSLTKAVRDAARFAGDNSRDGLKQFELGDVTEISNIVVFGNIAGTGTARLPNLQVSDVTVRQIDKGVAPRVREHVEVTVNYAYQPLSPVIPKLGFLSSDVNTSFTLTASSTMPGI